MNSIARQLMALESTKNNGRLQHLQGRIPHAKFTRSSEGVLEVVLHTDGGPLIFDGYAHEEFVDLFHQIGQDGGNRVVILTGAGEAGAR